MAICIIFEAIKYLFQNLNIKWYLRKIVDCTFDVKTKNLALDFTYRSHWEKRSLEPPRLVGELSHHVEYTDFSQHLVYFWDYLIFCFLK